MPRASRTIDKKQLTIDRIRKFLWLNVRCQVSSVKCHLQPGFSYIEILLSMFLILALVAILLTTSTVYIHSRRTNLQTIATKMASCETERLRKLPFAQLPTADGQFDASCTVDLPKLPAGTTIRLIAGFGSPANPKIKQITTAVSWTEKGLARQIRLETLISENGL